jgi:hypothetical protein
MPPAGEKKSWSHDFFLKVNEDFFCLVCAYEKLLAELDGGAAADANDEEEEEEEQDDTSSSDDSGDESSSDNADDDNAAPAQVGDDLSDDDADPVRVIPRSTLLAQFETRAGRNRHFSLRDAVHNHRNHLLSKHKLVHPSCRDGTREQRNNGAAWLAKLNAKSAQERAAPANRLTKAQQPTFAQAMEWGTTMTKADVRDKMICGAATAGMSYMTLSRVPEFQCVAAAACRQAEPVKFPRAFVSARTGELANLAANRFYAVVGKRPLAERIGHLCADSATVQGRRYVVWVLHLPGDAPTIAAAWTDHECEQHTKDAVRGEDDAADNDSDEDVRAAAGADDEEEDNTNNARLTKKHERVKLTSALLQTATRKVIDELATRGVLVLSVTTDNGSNFVGMADRVGTWAVRCMCHGMQLLARIVMKMDPEVASVFRMLRCFVDVAKRQKHGAHGDMVRRFVKEWCDTRWNSELLALEVFAAALHEARTNGAHRNFVQLVASEAEAERLILQKKKEKKNMSAKERKEADERERALNDVARLLSGYTERHVAAAIERMRPFKIATLIAERHDADMVSWLEAIATSGVAEMSKKIGIDHAVEQAIVDKFDQRILCPAGVVAAFFAPGWTMGDLVPQNRADRNAAINKMAPALKGLIARWLSPSNRCFAALCKHLQLSAAYVHQQLLTFMATQRATHTDAVTRAAYQASLTAMEVHFPQLVPVVRAIIGCAASEASAERVFSRFGRVLNSSRRRLSDASSTAQVRLALYNDATRRREKPTLSGGGARAEFVPDSDGDDDAVAAPPQQAAAAVAAPQPRRRAREDDDEDAVLHAAAERAMALPVAGDFRDACIAVLARVAASRYVRPPPTSKNCCACGGRVEVGVDAVGCSNGCGRSFHVGYNCSQMENLDTTSTTTKCRHCIEDAYNAPLWWW